MKNLLTTTLLTAVLGTSFISVSANDTHEYTTKDMTVTTVYDKENLDDDKLADFDSHGSDDGVVGAGADKDSVLDLLGEKEQTHTDVTVVTRKHVHGNGH